MGITYCIDRQNDKHTDLSERQLKALMLKEYLRHPDARRRLPGVSEASDRCDTMESFQQLSPRGPTDDEPSILSHTDPLTLHNDPAPCAPAPALHLMKPSLLRPASRLDEPSFLEEEPTYVFSRFHWVQLPSVEPPFAIAQSAYEEESEDSTSDFQK